MDEAVACYRKAIELELKNTSANAGLLSNFLALGSALKDHGKRDEAIDAYQKALESTDRFGNERRLLARTQRELCTLLQSAGREREAEQLFQQARAGWEKLAQDDDLHYRWELAWFLVTWPDPRFHDPPKAIELAEQLVKEAPEVRHFWRALGAAHLRAENWPAAASALEKGSELSDWGSAWDWFFHAMVHWQMGDKEGARRWYDHASANLEQYRGHYDIGEILQFQAEAAKLMGITVQQPETTRKNPRSN